MNGRVLHHRNNTSSRTITCARIQIASPRNSSSLNPNSTCKLTPSKSTVSARRSTKKRAKRLAGSRPVSPTRRARLRVARTMPVVGAERAAVARRSRALWNRRGRIRFRLRGERDAFPVSERFRLSGPVRERQREAAAATLARPDSEVNSRRTLLRPHSRGAALRLRRGQSRLTIRPPLSVTPP